MKKLLIIPLALLFSFNLLAQGQFSFNEERFDFGVVSEGTKAVHEFEFKNTGDAPIVISNVRASCGCTTPYWTKEPVMPGETGKVKASYNSQGRPGTFNKSITITSNAGDPTKVLYIKGIVERESSQPDYSEEQKKKSPELTIDKTGYNFGKVERGEKVARKFSLKNTGKSELVIGKIQSACNCVTSHVEKKALAPGESTSLELIYRPSYNGVNKDVVTIFTNSINNPRTELTLEGNVVQHISSGSPMKQGTDSPF